MSQPCCMGLPAVSVSTLFLHVFCCAMLQHEKAALEGGMIYETAMISIVYLQVWQALESVYGRIKIPPTCGAAPK
jgi:hypothetical protein